MISSNSSVLSMYRGGNKGNLLINLLIKGIRAQYMIRTSPIEEGTLNIFPKMFSDLSLTYNDGAQQISRFLLVLLA